MIIRKDIFIHDGIKFTGSFPTKCQEKSMPSSLKSLISLIYNGPNLKNQDKNESQPFLTIGQMIIYNTKKRLSDSHVKTRHTLEQAWATFVHLRARLSFHSMAAVQSPNYRFTKYVCIHT